MLKDPARTEKVRFAAFVYARKVPDVVSPGAPVRLATPGL